VQYGAGRGAVSVSLDQIADALMAGRILAYAQGFRILRQAAEEYNWPLDFARIAQIWRAGCIIRAALLDDIAEAFENSASHGGQLLEAEAIAAKLQAALPSLRAVAGAALGAGHPAPALSSAVSFFDSLRIGSGTANIIQAQRDFFGRHGFERLDQEGKHHGPWWD
jgi:6-phosphogluconate dehydrogenase